MLNFQQKCLKILTMC